MRKERDFIGEVGIKENALYGIHSFRARENFPEETRFHKEWYTALGSVKRACYETILLFNHEVLKKYKSSNLPLIIHSDDVLNAMMKACDEIITGQHFEHFIVPAISGGAGTSINMNMNEIITNLALIKLNQQPGNYDMIDPIEHANLYQSTNDVVPTALKVAVMKLLSRLEEKINNLRISIENIERTTSSYLRTAYTQMQEAVPSSYGRLFSTYSEALSRDWWRVSKCFERIKVVNLGGSAIGTGLTVPRYFIMEVVHVLQRLSGLPVTRGENLSDATANLDSFVEIHGILKAHAVNLEKMVSDIRLLSSDLIDNKEINIPKKQVGSSIMPGKVNPVIPEFVISCSHKIYANDQLIASLSAQGCLDLNAYLPAIGHAMIESLQLLMACNETILKNILHGITINEKPAMGKLINSPSIVTALLPIIGYNKAADLSNYMKKHKCSVFEANKALKIVREEKLKETLKPSGLLNLGFRIKDIIDHERKGE